MKLLCKHLHDGIWYSNNGHLAWLQGERPKFLVPADLVGWRPTIPHHVQRLRRTIVKNNYSHELVMFYAPICAAKPAAV